MAIIKTKARQDSGISRVSEGDDVYIRSTRDGSLFIADWKQAMILEGRGFMFNVGDLSNPAKGGGTGSLLPDADSPEWATHIPSGTSIIPIRIEIEVGAPVITSSTNEVDILIGVDQDASLLGLDVGVTEIAHNMNTLHPRTSNCTTISENSTAITTVPVVDLEFLHVFKIAKEHTSVGVVWQGLTMLYEPETPPIINGPACFIGWWGGSVATYAFASVQYIELPTSML